MGGRKASLVYLERDGRYLILHRTKKDHDENHDKWIGLGGKFEPGETPDACALREVREESGLTMTDFTLRGLITFVSDVWGLEYMYLYTAMKWTGRLVDSIGISDFRLRVYLELLNVPQGETVTYGELARRNGYGSVQAVGQALRRDPFAPEISCHRVVAFVFVRPERYTHDFIEREGRLTPRRLCRRDRRGLRRFTMSCAWMKTIALPMSR